MKIIYNNCFPFGNFKAINLFGLLFVKGDSISDITLNHEEIHTAQMKEMLFIGFYLSYFLEWLYQCIVRIFNSNMRAYYFITLEQEAYDNDNNLNYLETRSSFAWWKYIGKWVKY